MDALALISLVIGFLLVGVLLGLLLHNAMHRPRCPSCGRPWDAKLPGASALACRTCGHMPDTP